jgi:hypothetical protein
LRYLQNQSSKNVVNVDLHKSVKFHAVLLYNAISKERGSGKPHAPDFCPWLLRAALGGNSERSSSQAQMGRSVVLVKDGGADR